MTSTASNRLLRLAPIGAPALLVACLLGALPADAEPGVSCKRYPVDLDNVWLQSIAPYGDSILAVDPAELRVLKISPLESVRNPGDRVTESFVALQERPSSARFVPTLIQRLNGHFLLSNGVDELLEVSPSPAVLGPKAKGPKPRSFEVVRAMDSLKAGRGSDGKIIGVFTWAATAEDHLIALANVRYPDDTLKRGFVWVERSSAGSFRLLREVEIDSEEANFYTIMHPYLATIGEKGYILSMEEQPAIYEYDGVELRRLEIPPALRQRPSLPPKDGASTMPDMYAAVEQSTAPVGLYAWQGHLWLLGRSPSIEGGTEWSLHRIDPSGPSSPSRTLAKFYLPTKSEQLALAFADDHLSVLEKGSVKVLGRQDVKSLLHVPTDWLAEASRALRQPMAPAECD